tara:strand:+ start:93 stop:509 length:417 start_codon:yes stop_codon:yes gene_type:complete
MTSEELLRHLESNGATVSIVGDQLRISPKQVITPEIMQQLKLRKDGLIDLLKQRAARKWENISLDQLEKEDIAMNIKSILVDDTIWLVSNKALTSKLNKKGVVYTANEAKLLTSLPKNAAKNLHQLKKMFNGEIIEDK